MPPVIVEPSPLQSNPLGNTDDYAFQGKPSKRGGQRRTLYYAVKIGHTPGVYESWDEAERSIKAHAAPQWKTFKTYAAAEAFVAGRDGGSFRVTHRNPVPLNEHLKNFPPSTPLSSSSSFRPPISRQTRAPPANAVASSSSSLWSPSADVISPLDGPLKPPRPHFARSRTSSSGNSSPVRRSSPLRQEVTDEEEVGQPPDSPGATEDGHWTSGSESDAASATSSVKKGRRASKLSIGGWLSPPTSPETSTPASPTRAALAQPTAAYVRPSSPSATIPRMQDPPRSGKRAGGASPQSRPAVGGLWADLSSTLPASPPTSPSFPPDALGAPPTEINVADNAPKFSRSQMKRNSNVVLPVSAKAVSSANSRPLSRMITPRHSASDLHADASRPGMGRKASDRNSLPTMKSLMGLHDKLAALSSTLGHDEENRSTAIATTTDNIVTPPSPARIAKQRTASSHSLASIASMISDSSFVSAPTSPTQEETPSTPSLSHNRLSTIEEQLLTPPPPPKAAPMVITPTHHLALPSGLAITRLTPPSSASGCETVSDSSSTEHMSPLTPATSNHSSSNGGSVATHTQSEMMTGRYGRRKGSLGSRSGWSTSSSSGGLGKKLLHVFRLGKGSSGTISQKRRVSG